MNVSSEPGDRRRPTADGHGLTRLAVGIIALAALAFGIAQADRLPGAAGELIRANVETDRDATALFYTEVHGWDEWGRQRPPS